MLAEAERTTDVFLSYHNPDKALVEELAKLLREEGFSLFLDSHSLVPGDRWLQAMETALSTCSAFVVCLGASGLGSWSEREVGVALERDAREASFPIIPILLPGASRSQQIENSPFLSQYQFLDLRQGIKGGEGFDRVVAELRTTHGKASRWRRPRAGLTPTLVEPALERLQNRFSESLRHHFAGGQLICRKETQELLAQLHDDVIRVVVVHGVAGSGKSGVLFEFAEELAKQGIPFLPLRLDRYELRGDPKRFGVEALDLPESPVRCLAALENEQGGVLLLDQLDALRWTSAHSAEAWDVCREMISEALISPAGLKVVVCCRTFDLDHDPRLRGWEKETKNLQRVEVQQLSPEDVTAAIQRAAKGRENIPELRFKEQDLLRHIHHLQMWLAIYKSTENAPAFDTAWSLMGQFWATRLDELVKAGITREQAAKLDLCLVKAMKQGAVLMARRRNLDMSHRELELYQHHHLLQFDVSRDTVTFCHQSYQDYLVAKHLLGELDQCGSEEGGHKVVAWLGSREEQSLFRREQLRLLLGALRAEEHEAYLPTLRELLPIVHPETSSQVRFHLRLLTLQFLGQVANPRTEESHLVLALLDHPFWHEHVLAEVVRGQVPWFEVLDDHDKLKAWLAGEDQSLLQSALDILLYCVEKCGDRVARLLAPYRDKGEAWIRKIMWVLRFDPSQDSDALFEFRLQLTKEGAYTAEHVDWDKLAESNPLRFIELVSWVLVAFGISMRRGENRRRPGRRGEIDWHTLDKVSSSVIPPQHLAPAWEAIFRATSFVVQLRAYPQERKHVLESYAVDFETLKPVLGLLKDLGRALLENNWLEFVSLGEQLSREDLRAEALFLDSLVEGPVLPELADWALGWLMADPWRSQLRLRTSSDMPVLAGRLIERFAPVCSEEIYRRLEQWLLTYLEPDFFESYKRRHERIDQSRGLNIPSSFGRTPFALLPRLPGDRRSIEVASRLAQLSRKFPPQDQSSEREDDAPKAGWVRSPLSDDAKTTMSDQAWLAIATNEKLPAHWGKIRWKSNELFEQASIETLAGEFCSMTQRYPERFARLALRLPQTSNPAFLRAVVSGLAWRDDRPQEGWTPPSHAILEDILALPAVQEMARSQDHEEAKALCRILERYSEYPWSERALDLIVWIAQQHCDPEPGVYPVGLPQEESAGFDRLEANALNVTRGTAGFAIRSLLFQQPAIFSRLRPALASLVRDEHPAVRVAALAACLPVIKIDRDLAVDWFLQACEGPDAILATRETAEMLRYTYRTHLDRLRPLIARMVACPLPKVATAGAVPVAACFLVMGQLEEEFERCLGGTPAQRKGIAQVAASLLGEHKFAQKAKTTLLRMAEDEDKQVAQAVAHSFRQLDLLHINADREAWNRFARSKAFQADPSPLLHALDRQEGKLLPFADCLLAVGTTFAEELADDSKNFSRGISADVRELLPLLLRVYEQAQREDQQLYLRCLDLWDRLLERRVGAAMGLTRELDRL